MGSLWHCFIGYILPVPRHAFNRLECQDGLKAVENLSKFKLMSDLLWSEILKQLETKFSRPNYITWLKPSRLIEESGGIVTIGVNNDYARDWITKNALKEIVTLLQDKLDDYREVRVLVSLPTKTGQLEDLPLLAEVKEEGSAEPEPSPGQFNPNYSFATFIVGNNNRLAFAASQVVAEKPGNVYNPLFIYGGVGLGKTHLMQAIGNEISQKAPKKKIIYVSCETFTSEFISALQNKTVDAFKKKYRTVDVFLVDDIQFLANKEGTQEEFFHTFNNLHQSNRQIVVTADRVPREIANLEERLTSRFGWGMIADIQAPNFETRMAILQEKAEERGLSLPQEIIEHIANTISSNVRELEGALIKVATAAQVEKVNPTLDFTRATLKDLATNKVSANISTKKIIQTMARHFDLDSSDIIGPRRNKELVYARQITMYLLRSLLNQSYPQIGEAMGGRDHTTVMYSVDKIERLRKTSYDLEKDLSAVQQLLHS